jgi:hypothetical protein
MMPSLRRSYLILITSEIQNAPIRISEDLLEILSIASDHWMTKEMKQLKRNLKAQMLKKRIEKNNFKN